MPSIRPLSPELQEIAISQLNEDPKRIEADILAIKEWLKKQPHLTCRLDDQWILNYLRGCKFSLERTKEKIDNHLTFKTLLPEFFRNKDPTRPELREIFELGLMVPLKMPDAKGRTIIFVRNGPYNPKKQPFNDFLKCNFIHTEVSILEDDRANVAGIVSIIDFKGLGMDHVLHMPPAILKKAFTVHQDGYPLRPQAIHYINAPSAFETFFNLFKSFMKKKLVDRLTIHGSDLTELYKHVPKAALPNEYGGEAGPIDELAAEWHRKIVSYKDWLIEDEKYGSNEKKRIGKAKTSSDLFGIEGSFRTLNLD